MQRRRTSTRTRIGLAVAAATAAIGLGGFVANPVKAGVEVVTSTFTAADGITYWAKNHLTTVGGRSAVQRAAAATETGRPRQYLVVWAGDANATDTTGAAVKQLNPAVNPVRITNQELVDAAPGQDFLAVIDVDATSPDYGKVVNTITVGPLVSNEPHHMQYLHHKGHKIFAGGLYTDVTYVFDVSGLPAVTLERTSPPTETPCGTIPDAYWTLADGSAYGTYMGGPDVPGPCTYTDGQVRVGNGFGGTPGSIVRFDEDGRFISEVPAALPTAENAALCPSYPALPVASCANPHGIQAREDLNILVASDYAEPRNIVLDPVKPQDAGLFRPTVRTWDITDRDLPKLRSVAVMPDGPRKERNPGHEERSGIMEVTVTNLPGHKGAFASSMCGGVIYYTPDITSATPQWREVFDDTRAAREINPQVHEGGGCDGGGWVQTSGDDKYLYHAVIGRGPGSLDAYDTGSAKMVYALDIQKLLAAGTGYRCNIDTIGEVYDGGAEADCPTLASVVELQDETSGGPHWGSPDNFVRTPSGRFQETKDWKRIAVSNYFVARTGVDGNHKVCMLAIGKGAKLTLDTSFRDENEGTPCVSFNRTTWPHGATGNAKPHSSLFVLADSAFAS